MTALFRTRRATRRRLAAAAVGLCALATLLAASGLRGHAAGPAPSDRVTISVVGTSDLHGSVFDRNGRGGLAIFA